VNRSDLAPLLIALHDLQEQITLDKRHCYRMNKAVVPGVTTIIKTLDAPALDAWKVRVQVEGTARVAFQERPWENEDQPEYVDRLSAMAKLEFEHERLANEAADVGKQVHALIEHAVREQLGRPSIAPEATDEALFVFAGWRGWAARVGLEPLMAEGRVYHGGHNYCGTFDLLALVGGEPTLFDWKPKPHLYDERRLQLAAYRKALIEMGWPDLQGAIVCLPRDGGEINMVPACAPGPELDASFDAFVSLLRVYRWQKEVAKTARKAAKEEAA
jgi:hypothetical protein